MSKEHVDCMIHNLMVIANLNENEKLFTKREYFYSEPIRQWQCVYRWYYVEEHVQNFRAIEKLFHNVFAHIETCLQKEKQFSNLENCNENDRIHQFQNQQIVQRLRKLLHEAINGLQKYKVTYDSDKNSKVPIDKLFTDIKDELDKIDFIDQMPTILSEFKKVSSNSSKDISPKEK